MIALVQAKSDHSLFVNNNEWINAADPHWWDNYSTNARLDWLGDNVASFFEEHFPRGGSKLQRLLDDTYHMRQIQRTCGSDRPKRDLETTDSQLTSACEDGWTLFSIAGVRQCLKNFGRHRNDEAVGLCQNEQAALISPKNEKENADLFAAFTQLGVQLGAAIDGNDSAQEGVWRYSNGDLMSYTNWREGQPNNYEGKEHLIQMWLLTPGSYEPSNGVWDDFSGEITTDTVCQKPAMIYPISRKFQ